MLKSEQVYRSHSTSPRMRATECSPMRKRGVGCITGFQARVAGGRELVLLYASVARCAGLYNFSSHYPALIFDFARGYTLSSASQTC